jgi:hypothetical protein
MKEKKRKKEKKEVFAKHGIVRKAFIFTWSSSFHDYKANDLIHRTIRGNRATDDLRHHLEGPFQNCLDRSP